MRTFGLLLLTGLTAVSSSVSAVDFAYAWAHPQPQGNAVYGFAFADARTGWAVAGGGGILRTGDGGEHWELLHQPLAVAPDLHDIVVTATGTLVACGAGRGIYRSTDGGTSWQPALADPPSRLRDLTLTPAGAISAAGDLGVVLLSLDDGLTWSPVGPGLGEIRHHLWRDDLTAYAVGAGVAHRTTDGGVTWQRFLPQGWSPPANEVVFADARHGTVVSDWEIWITDDGGATWRWSDTDGVVGEQFRTLVLTPTHWLAAANGARARLWETLDGGVQWTLRQNFRARGFWSLAQAPGGRVFGGSEAGDLYWSDDLGKTMHDATVDLATDAPNAPISLLVHRPDGVCFAAIWPQYSVDRGCWLSSDDGGATWATAPATGLGWVGDAVFLDSRRGLAANHVAARVTDDGGGTWRPAAWPPGIVLDRLAWPAPERAFAAVHRLGGGGAILRSADGGATWTTVTGGLPEGEVVFRDIVFATPEVGYAAGGLGAKPRLYRTVDGGLTWGLIAAGGPMVPIVAMAWFDARHGVAATGWPQLWVTADAGSTWQVADHHAASRFVRRNDREALAVGCEGSFCLFTADAGTTWQVVQPPLSSSPGAGDLILAAAPTGDGWVLGGDCHRLLVARTATPTAVQDADRPRLAAPRLLARPSPFNPATELTFTIAASTHATLAIYDPRGRQVRALPAGHLPAGDHTVRWDGRDDLGRALASGVYLARLTTSAGQAATARLVLVR